MHDADYKGHGSAAGGPGRAERSMDWNAARERVDDDEDILRSMVEVFVAECPDWLAAIHEAAAQGDPDALTRSAHHLKGAAQALEAQPTAALAMRLEDLGRERRVDEAAPLIGELRATTEALLSDLEKRLATGNPLSPS